VLPFIVAGLAAGSIYGLAGIGLVLTYKTSGVFNFGFGAIGTVAAYLFYTLYVTDHMAWFLAAPISIIVVGGVLGMLFAAISNRLAAVTVGHQIAATIGIFLVIQASVTIIYGSAGQLVPNFLPAQNVGIFGAEIGVNQIIIFSVGLAVAFLLYFSFRFTRRGMEMRAVVDNPNLLNLAGKSPTAVRRWAWIIGCLFASTAGVLLVPNLSLDATTITLLVIQAFAAAAVGRFSNLPLTYLGGIVIGVAASVATKYLSGESLLGGLPASMPFIILFLVLLVSPRGRNYAKEAIVRTTNVRWSVPFKIQIGLAVPLLAVLIALPVIVGTNLTNFTSALTFAILFLSLGFLVRTAGQVSLCQAGFAAIGACTFGHLVVNDGVPWLPAVICAGLIVVPLGVVLALPAIRLSGLYLALATFGFGLLLQSMFYTSTLMFGPLVNGLAAPRPSLSWLAVSGDDGFYYVVLAFFILISGLVVLLVRTRLGRLLRGMADSPVALNSLGNNAVLTRILVFCISAFIAAISGALYASLLTSVSGTDFDPLQALTYLALIVIVVGEAPWYALFACIGIAIIPAYVDVANINEYLEIVFGFFAIVTVVAGPAHVPGRLRTWLQARDRRGPRLAIAPDLPLSPTDHAGLAFNDGTRFALQAELVTVRFGGLVALNGVSVDVQPGRIVGLIGPNGAGKTTLLNVYSGMIRPTDGLVRLGGRDITGQSVQRRARAGIGRTYQHIELFETMTVFENVAMGPEARLAGGSTRRQLLSTRAESGRIRSQATSAIELCGLSPIAERQVSAISTGQRRLVELARCIAGDFELLLLDEPSSGLDQFETAEFGRTLLRTSETRGTGMILVEHDMSLVMSVCDYIYVLDFGTIIFKGTPTEVQSSDIVRTAYLGDDFAVSAAGVPDGG
jgi:ABC-type branched-subunit amino acid transport system ATPase component/branched-subunit amino acid ABC-type transport system permease component